ncbi:hypothetical protein N7466_010079 [Penicillium verhagenii]|uniref:uncharacterized protein n=1 Tax=Penicillium verhagenii TaxID=1562060 RepID=UPI0025452DD0|nr:uncharacterized protein N7466_010079 [Penicillium verhagenii]KAJ5919136.1 hypothetical protein N7466_010079 [Penicillium verhagenii]
MAEPTKASTQDPELPPYEQWKLWRERHTSEADPKYRDEQEKRIHPQGIFQYRDFEKREESTMGLIDVKFQEVNFTIASPRVVIIGAGFGGLLLAVRIIQAGFCMAKDIMILDEGTDFGGTWNWNRYPGLMCDIESYIYLPLLEETGYKPSGKYVSGVEIQQHAVRIAKQWNLVDRTFFGFDVRSMVWNERDSCWEVEADTPRGYALIEANFALFATGLLNTPKVPAIEGLDQFKGKVIHSSRWDYTYTGGSWENPEMDKLKDKRIGVIGTGASAVQIIPELAKYAKDVIVFQRTPSSVRPRNGHVVHDDSEFEELGWQRKRMENFNAFLSNEHPLPEKNLVNDSWSNMQSYSVLIGGPSNLDEKHLKEMLKKDTEIQNEVRKRISDIVNSPETAESLSPYYYGWCKRPCFSDVFLQTFNKPSVSLVDTKGKGIDGINEQGIMANGASYDLDAILFCTGYGLGSAVDRSRFSITGRGGQSLRKKWHENGIATLHGVMSCDFPNLFFTGPYQTAATANYLYILDQLAIHVAFILSQAGKLAEASTTDLEASDTDLDEPAAFTVEPTRDGEEQWAKLTGDMAYGLHGSHYLCTPSYLNAEGLVFGMSKEQAEKVWRGTVWGKGVKDYINRLEKWRTEKIEENLKLTFLDEPVPKKE